MRIAYLCTDFGIPIAGNKGASIHVRELSAAIVALGHQVEIITCRAGGDPPADFDVKVMEFPLAMPERTLAGCLQDDPEASEPVVSAVRSMLYAATARYRMLPFLQRMQPDAIYERYSLLGTVGMDLAGELEVPHILEVNAPLSEEHARHRGIAFAQTIRAVEQRVLGAADQVISVSRPLKEWILATGVDEHRVTVLPNGVDINRFPAGSADIRQRHSFGHRPVIGFVGTLKRWHGTETLIRATGRLVRQRGMDNAPVLLIVGDGPERERLEAISREEGVADLTTFTGMVAHDQVPAYIGAMDIAVAPYDKTPEFYFSPLKLFEYMAAGRAIVAARIGQIEECIRDAETGLLYPPGDIQALAHRLAQLIDTPGLGAMLGNAARQEAEAHHSWDRNAKAVVDLMNLARVNREDRAESGLTRVGAARMSVSTATLKRQVRGLQVSFAMIIRFRRELMKHWPRLLLAVTCALGYTAMRLAEPWPLKFLFDNVLIDEPLVTPFSTLNNWLGTDRMRVLMLAVSALVVFALLRGIFYYFQSVLTTGVGQEVVIGIRQQLFAHVQRLSLRFHNRSSTGDLLMRFTGDINNLLQLLAASLLSLITESIILISFVTVMFIMNWQLALLATVTMPAIFLLMVFYSSRIRTAARKQRRREGELAARLHESLANMHIVQMFAREREEEERLRKLNKRSLRTGMKATRLEGQLNQGIEISVAIGMALTVWVGANQVINGRLTPGELLVFMTYMQSFYRPMRRLSRVAERASKASSCIDRITEVLDREPDIQNGAVDAGRLRGSIQFRDVSFSYDDDRAALRNITLNIAAGQTVALVGSSGAGKSTLLSLVPRLYDTTSGGILVDGQDIRDFTLRSLRENISVVPQDGALFAGTIHENIGYGNMEATDQEIVTAARDASLHEFIITLPEGYETKVSERGASLSGGQRQRLAIARALVKDAPIVLLDEPTTGLDADSEQMVIDALARLLQGRTAIIIAHRLDTIQRADMIVVLDEGEIFDRGTHQDLLRRSGRYRDLYQLQNKDWTAREDALTAAAWPVGQATS